MGREKKRRTKVCVESGGRARQVSGGALPEAVHHCPQPNTRSDIYLWTEVGKTGKDWGFFKRKRYEQGGGEGNLRRNSYLKEDLKTKENG